MGVRGSCAINAVMNDPKQMAPMKYSKEKRFHNYDFSCCYQKSGELAIAKTGASDM
jgi:hypothetical protein